MATYDCIVIGSGHAGATAALAAVGSGCDNVLIVEKSPKDWAGGNGYFTAGVHRTAHAGLEDLLSIVRNLKPEDASQFELEAYTPEDYAHDIMLAGDSRADPVLVNTMAKESRDAIEWLARAVEIPFVLSFQKPIGETNSSVRQKLIPSVALSVEGGGKGMIEADLRALEKAKVAIWFDSPATSLLAEGGTVTGVVVRRNGEEVSLTASAIVLAAGGYESSPELRAKYLGPGWERAFVRGTPYNTGDGFPMAQAVGARLAGNWKECHTTCWDANAPANTGDHERYDNFPKRGYPSGIMVNVKGERFVDEGEDFAGRTFGKFSREILHQPEGFVFQIWARDAIALLSQKEYGDGIVEKITASTIEELAEKLTEKGLQDKDTFLGTVQEYNDAVRRHRAEHPELAWNIASKDGLSTQSSAISLKVPKSNWALPLDDGPFLAVKAACAITFTFGGLEIDPDTAGVLSQETCKPIKGLFCTGEMVGGLYYGGHPSGCGLTAGTVFGRKAGRGAAKLAGKFVQRGL
ncbi:FAD/NAD(P)-binding domain-containing protein [Leucogyrophana mollusca]|uniref:FAD/NAD(P)-binding domain-containing protein n=1 Tax=Leucogyrophana mollusca TaxID=85980 RepID=A0ACB8BDV9_9AGAM|nr:FAD/NAD(P)-binding domain-containing protein [Leucogyrophana mollusca]